MIAYYIHWRYSASADDANFYAGQDDDKLFHHKENAEKYAKDKINEWNDNSRRFDYLNNKDEEYGLSPEEKEEWTKLALICCGDLPYDYSICERDIKFEDEIQITNAKIWIARDKDGKLYLYTDKPVLGNKGISYFAPSCVVTDYMRINTDFHPEITFENSPQQIEI